MDDDGCQFLPRLEGCDCILDFDHQLFKLEVVQNKPLYVYAGFYGTNILRFYVGLRQDGSSMGSILKREGSTNPKKDSCHSAISRCCEGGKAPPLLILFDFFFCLRNRGLEATVQQTYNLLTLSEKDSWQFLLLVSIRLMWINSIETALTGPIFWCLN